ncbi:MAG: hypothetical protein KKI06_14270, partial [Euryarchaeota archaeon]|nr:hypothetical protein [Euryarchaeota archaeon]
MKQIIKGETTMNIKTIVTIAAVLVVLGAGIAVARPAANDGGFWNGMMGGLNNGINGIMGYGMMGQGNGYGGMMGQGTGNGTTGVCGLTGTTDISNDATPITIEQAKGSV